MPSVAPNLRALIKETFDEAQITKTCHTRNVKKLTKILNNYDVDEFTETYLKFLRVPLSTGDANSHVDNFLDFTVKFAMSLPPEENLDDSRGPDDEDDDSVSLSTFALKILNYCQVVCDAADKSVRYRVCQFISKMLKSMPDNAVIDDDLFESLQKAMISRSLDKVPKVRVQALSALERLQEPTDPKCKVQSLYVWHLSRDPCADVRKVIIESISKTSGSIKEVVQRIHDINDSVRKAAYLFVNKIKVTAFSIKQRVKLLKQGLNDSSKKVRDAVGNILLKTWCEFYDNEYLRLLEALDAQTFEETSIQVLNIIFEQSERDKLIQQLPLEPESKLIPIERLTSENALYWRCLVEYLRKESCEEKLEECCPVLTHFCKYIQEYQSMMASKNFTPLEEATQEFILCQLYKIAKTYDLSDEVGRRNMDKLICETLQGEKCSIAITELITLYYEKVQPDVDKRLQNLAHIISEIRIPTSKTNMEVEEITDAERNERKMQQALKQIDLHRLEDELYLKTQERDFIEAQKIKEQIDELKEEIKRLSVNSAVVQQEHQQEDNEEKNDSETMMRCLTIACCVAQVNSVTTLNPVLRSLYDNLILPSLNHSDFEVQLITLKAIGIFSLLDIEIAKQKFWDYLMFFFTVGEVNTELYLISLKVIFDLLLRYGLETFNISTEGESTINTTANDTQTKSRRTRSMHRLHSNTSESLAAESLISDASTSPDKNFLKIMTALCDNTDEKIRTLATEGFCKLLLHQRLSSVNLVSRFIIMLFNPANEECTQLIGTLRTFFSYYPNVVDNSQDVLQRAFMPTLRKIADAPNESPLITIELEHVAAFILQITDCDRLKSRDDHTVHNNLAVAILAKALNDDDDEPIDKNVLLKSLKHLNVDASSDQMKQDLLSTIDDIVTHLQRHERHLMVCINTFRKKIEGVVEQDTDRSPDRSSNDGETETENENENDDRQEREQDQEMEIENDE